MASVYEKAGKWYMRVKDAGGRWRDKVTQARTKTEARRIPLKAQLRATEGRLMQFGDSSVPIGVVVHPGGKRAWVAHANADVITVLDLENWTVAGTLEAGREPDGMAYSPLAVTAAPAPAR